MAARNFRDGAPSGTLPGVWYAISLRAASTARENPRERSRGCSYRQKAQLSTSVSFSTATSST